MSAGAPPVLTRWVGAVPEGPAGVVHVAAVWTRPDGTHATLRVGAGAPRTASDAVVLSGARARSDAIVTTGRILREEPDLVHELIAPRAANEALATWRRALGLDAPPLLAVLTASGELPPRHPALLAAPRLLFFSGRAGAARLRATKGYPAQAEIVEHARPSARALISHLQVERGARSILVEAGPSAAAPLYDAPSVIDELWLTVCTAAKLEPADVVGPFIATDTIEAALGRPVHREEHDDAGLGWATLVYRRAARRSRAAAQPRPRSAS